MLTKTKMYRNMLLLSGHNDDGVFTVMCYDLLLHLVTGVVLMLLQVSSQYLHSDVLRLVAGIFTVMCYNVLCDKYATRQMYGYCPSWALTWEYRKKGILDEIRHYSADIISLQEVETSQFYNFFLPELKRDGYDGIFSPKSRAKTMAENERKYVDGCAIFYRTANIVVPRVVTQEVTRPPVREPRADEVWNQHLRSLHTRGGVLVPGTSLTYALAAVKIRDGIQERA
uniref:Endonuclease/exonuclease/phosphatase domain-containing protein n=1 Tax=Timema douglasi TaxID=61478 RepID=A0A7R8ZFN2_TIMDO|nr:unnamed protein product [Timema douglasi]